MNRRWLNSAAAELRRMTPAQFSAIREFAAGSSIDRRKPSQAALHRDTFGLGAERRKDLEVVAVGDDRRSKKGRQSGNTRAGFGLGLSGGTSQHQRRRRKVAEVA